MPPVIALAAFAAGLFVVGRYFKREMQRVGEVVSAANAAPKPVEIRLERDPRDGVYRDRS